MTDSAFPRPNFAWQLHPATAQFENAWMRVESFPAVDPNGREAEYGLVHFKNLAIGILPYEDGHIWLVGQSRVPFEEYSWEIPAGGDPGVYKLTDSDGDGKLDDKKFIMAANGRCLLYTSPSPRD